MKIFTVYSTFLDHGWLVKAKDKNDAVTKIILHTKDELRAHQENAGDADIDVDLELEEVKKDITDITDLL